MKTKILTTVISTLAAANQLFASSSIITLSENNYLCNLDSRECGWPSGYSGDSSSVTPVVFALSSGLWKVIPTNPTLNSQATFMAWSPFGGGTWVSIMAAINLDTRQQWGKGHTSAYTYLSPESAYYDDESNVPFMMNVTNAAQFAFCTGDSYTGDNAGGVSVIVTRISDPFEFNSQPKSQSVSLGNSASFSASATNGIKPYSYQWFREGSTINDATNSVLELTNLQSKDEGTYMVVVTDSANNRIDSQPAALTVYPFGSSIALYAGVTISGVIGQTYGIQTTTDLSDITSWTGMTNITLTLPTQLWQDCQPALQSQRFYRVVLGPISIP
jgi:hypothetical protein